MKLRIRKLAALALVTALTPIAMHAQTLNPSYLSEMPAPARILAEIKGKDAEDTGERQMGAFMSLIKLIGDMAWGLGHRYVNDADNRAATTDERRIRLAYQTAYADLWHKVTNKEGHVYDHDLDLLNEMLQKFFSEGFRAQYFKTDRNAEADYRTFLAHGSSRSRQSNLPSDTSVTIGRPPDQSSSPSISSVSEPRSAAATDPSIPKAKAANVDTKVLGLPLGEPLRLPSCGSVFDISAPTRTCLKQRLDADPEPRRALVVSIGLPADSCPSWLSDCEANVATYDALLVAVYMNTKGHNVDQAVTRDLREKYGAPTSVKAITVTPRVGNPFKANNLEWLLPGLHVEYDVVTKGQNEGEVINVETGHIAIETEVAYHRRLANEKAKPKPKL